MVHKICKVAGGLKIATIKLQPSINMEIANAKLNLEIAGPDLK